MENEVEKELDQMIEDIDSTLDIKSDAVEDPEEEQVDETRDETDEEEVVETEEVDEVVEGEEEEVEEEEVVAEEVVEEEIEEEAVDHEAQLAESKERERVLLERIESMTQVAPATPEPEVTTEEVKSYLEGQDIDDVVSDPRKLEAVLLEVERRARLSATEDTLKAIPQLIITQVQQQQMLRDAANEFYNDNPDLAQVKRTVGAVATEIQSENPDWTLEQVFKETAPRARKVLGLKAKAPKIVKPRRPALVKPKGAARKPEAPDLSDVEQDILDTIEGGN